MRGGRCSGGGRKREGGEGGEGGGRVGWRSRGALNARNVMNGTRAVLIVNVKLFRGALRSSTFAMHGINAKLSCLASIIKEILNKGEPLQSIAAWSQES